MVLYTIVLNQKLAHQISKITTTWRSVSQFCGESQQHYILMYNNMIWIAAKTLKILINKNDVFKPGSVMASEKEDIFWIDH